MLALPSLDLSLGLSLAALFLAQDAVPVDRWVTRPEPTAADYPLMARNLALAGEAVVECEVDTLHRPIKCISISARPAHLGFEQAAVNIVQRGRLSPDMPSDNRFKVTVPFRMPPQETTPEPWDGPEPSEAQKQAGRSFANRTISRRPDMLARLLMSWRMNQLPQDQHDHLSQWIQELTPSRQQELNAMAEKVSLILAKHGLDEWPQTAPENIEVWRADMSRLSFDRDDAMMQEISRRYCARYSCLEN